MGGGALPIAYNKKNKKVYLLFGKENEYLNKDSPGWSDFGGGEKTGESALDTALREGCEELNGFFGCEGDIKRLVKDNLVTSLNHERYTTFLFEIDYDENLPIYFNNNYKFLKSHVNNLVRHTTNGLFEKSNIKWMTFDDLRKERDTFRSYYRNVVDVILENEDDITSKLSQNKKQRRRATAATAPTATTAPTAPTATTATAATTTPATAAKTTKTKSTHKTRRYNNYKYVVPTSQTQTTQNKNKRKSKKHNLQVEKIKTASKKWFQLW